MSAIPKQTPLYFGATREEFNTYRRRTTQIRQSQLQRLREIHNKQNSPQLLSLSQSNITNNGSTIEHASSISIATPSTSNSITNSIIPSDINSNSSSSSPSPYSLKKLNDTQNQDNKDGETFQRESFKNKETKEIVLTSKTKLAEEEGMADDQPEIMLTKEHQDQVVPVDESKFVSPNTVSTKPQMRWNLAAKLKDIKSSKSSNNSANKSNINKAHEYEVSSAVTATSAQKSQNSVCIPASLETTAATMNPQSVVIQTSNSIEPLSNVLLRIMFQPQYISNKPTSIQPRGLINSGNICFMSSILQSLIFCSPFYNILSTIEKNTVASFDENDSTTPLLDALIDFIGGFVNPDLSISSSNKIAHASNNVMDSKIVASGSSTSLSKKNRHNNSISDFGAPYNPQSFYQKINKTSTFSHLKWGEQEDAEEFLGYLLNGIHDEFLTVLKNMTNGEFEIFLKHSPLSSQSIWKANVINTLKSIQEKKDSDMTTTTTTSTTTSNNSIASDEWQEVVVERKSKKSKSSITTTRTNSQRIVEVKPTPISNLFGGQFRSELSVPNIKNGHEVSKTKSITLDPFQHIQLDISDNSVQSVHSALIHLSLPEQITYKSTENKEIFAQKQTFIDRLPKVLVIHLKRFSYVSSSSNTTTTTSTNATSSSPANNSDCLYYGQVQKLKKKISYGHTLEIPSQVLSKTMKDNNKLPLTYKLSGVVYHHGSSSNAGHYTVDVLRQDKSSWIRIDDTKVHPISEDDVVNDQSDDFKCAYILIYEKCC